MARTMHTISLTPDFFSDLGVIAQDETLMSKLQKYVKKLISSKVKDDSVMTKEEFFAKLDRSKKQIEEGNYVKFSNMQEFNDYFGVK